MDIVVTECEKTKMYMNDINILRFVYILEE